MLYLCRVLLKSLKLKDVEIVLMGGNWSGTIAIGFCLFSWRGEFYIYTISDLAFTSFLFYNLSIMVTNPIGIPNV